MKTPINIIKNHRGIVMHNGDFHGGFSMRIGLPMEPLFMQRVDEMLFGKHLVEAMYENETE